METRRFKNDKIEWAPVSDGQVLSKTSISPIKAAVIACLSLATVISLLAISPVPARAAQISESMALFAISAESSRISGTKSARVITVPLSSEVIAFSDRPKRIAEQYSLPKLARNWKPFGFMDVLPNAVIAVEGDSGSHQWVVELSKPKVRGAHVSFPIKPISVRPAVNAKDSSAALMNGSFNSTHIFIDPTDTASGAADSTYTPSPEAQDLVSRYSTNPTSIGNFSAISSPIPSGKSIVYFGYAAGGTNELYAAMSEAGNSLGWTFSFADRGYGSLEEQRQRLSAVIAQQPDGIAFSGLSVSEFGDLFLEAEKSGIAMICEACTDAPYGALKDTHVTGPSDFELWGRLIAAFTAASLTEVPKVEMFGYLDYPVLRQFDDAFMANLPRFAPGSSMAFTRLDFANGDLRRQVVDRYLANPDTNVLIVDLGEIFIGVPQALIDAGVSPGVAPLIAGSNAGLGSILSLRAGTSDAYIGYSLPIAAYSIVDSFARYWVGIPFATNTLPTQILTPENVNSAVINSSGDYVGVAEYAAQFRRIWGIA